MADKPPPEQEDTLLELSGVLRDEFEYIAKYRKAVGRERESGGIKCPAQASLEDCRKALFESGAAALCLSGGGIRSATFNLGVIQGLAKLGLLHRFDYLSTVSGGGYIGAWLSSWVFRAGDVKKTENALQRDPAPALSRAGHSRSSPLEWLRDYSNYLAPKPGLFSADTWTLVATYVRNLLVVWLAILPPLMLALFPPQLFELFLEPTHSTLRIWMIVVIALAGFLLLVWGEANSYLYEEDETGRHRASTYVRYVNVPYFFGAVFFAFAWIMSRKNGYESWIVPILTGALIVAITLVGIVSKWEAPEGDRANEARESNRYNLGACAVQAVVLACTLASFLILTWRGSGDVAPWHYVVYPAALLCALGAGDVVYAAFLSRASSDVDRERWARSAAWFAILAIGWISWTAIALLSPYVLRPDGSWNLPLHALGAALAAVLGFALARVGLSARSKAALDRAPGLAHKLLLPAAMLVFVLLVLALIASANVWLEEAVSDVVEYAEPRLSSWMGEGTYRTLAPWVLGVAVAVVLLVACRVMLDWININHFSMHAMYRDRLIRCYLGATRSAGVGNQTRFGAAPDPFAWFKHPKWYAERWRKQAKSRAPNPYIGFDDADNPDLFWLGIHRTQPLWVINMALNIVDNSERLSWQERKAASFTASPLHCGGWLTGYRRALWYGHPVGGLSAGTAMAISGAAANPSMGYHSSPVLTFLMTFFNVRLGWWLGNPNPESGKSHGGLPIHRERGPHYGLFQLLRELVGKTDAKSDWVHLSDGGHFENLGLYEMVLRRCRYVVVCDASADPERSLEDLGNAIRKVRTDLKVEIELAYGSPWQIGDREKTPWSSHAMFNIKYAEDRSTWGRLLYIKPSVYDTDLDLPKDVRQYANASPAFPHESTVDQFFSESQFESYRALGEYQLARQALQGLSPEKTAEGGLSAAFDRAHENLRAHVP